VTQKWIDPPKEKEADIWNDLRLYTIDQLVRTLQMEVNKATETAGHYVETLAISLQDITQSPELEFKGEPVQSLYSCLLDRLYGLNFEKYPKPLSENNLDAHLINIVRISSDYFTRQLVKSPPPGNSSSQTGFIKVIPSPPSVPVGADMSLSQYRWTLSQWRDNLWSGRSLYTFPVNLLLLLLLTTRIPITSV